MNSNIQKSVLRIFAFPLWMIKRWQGYDELHDFNWSSKGLLYSWLWSTIFKNFMLLVSRDILFISSSFISFFAVNCIRILRFIQWFHFGVTLVFIICQWHVKSCQVSSLSLSLDDSCPFCQHNDINEIWKQLNLFFSNICNWLVGNKLSIHFGEDKRKSILFVSKLKRKNILKTDIKYRDIRIKQHANNVWRSSFT